MVLLAQISRLSPKARARFVLPPVTLSTSFFPVITQEQSVRVTCGVVGEALSVKKPSFYSLKCWALGSLNAKDCRTEKQLTSLLASPPDGLSLPTPALPICSCLFTNLALFFLPTVLNTFLPSARPPANTVDSLSDPS